MGQENLKPFRSVDEARENGKKGGKASGKARRRKRDIKGAARLVLSLPAEDQSTQELLNEIGINSEEWTYKTAIIVKLLKNALKGDIRAAKLLVEWSGETPQQQLEEKKFKQSQKDDKPTDSMNILEAWFNSIPDDDTEV